MLQIRLTYNYWRRGGYKVGSEDYRWYDMVSLTTASTYSS